MSAPLFVAHDALLGVDVSQPVDRAEAGRLATEASIAAGNRGERVATDTGRDRFTVRPAPAEPLLCVVATAGQLAAQNVLFYSHTGRFCFGWRDGGLGPEVVSRLLDVMSEFPGSYDIKTADGRTLSGN